MLVLLQLLKAFQDAESRESIKDFFKLAEYDLSEIDELAICLYNNGVELTDTQVDMLKRISQNGTWKSAFAMAEMN